MLVRNVCNRNDAKNSFTARIDRVKCVAHISKTSEFLKQINFSEPHT